jgi:hypothetical protein
VGGIVKEGHKERRALAVRIMYTPSSRSSDVREPLTQMGLVASEGIKDPAKFAQLREGYSTDKF